MKLTKRDVTNGAIYFGASKRKDCSIVIYEFKNAQNQTRFSFPVSNLVFTRLADAVNHLVRKGY